MRTKLLPLIVSAALQLCSAANNPADKTENPENLNQKQQTGSFQKSTFKEVIPDISIPPDSLISLHYPNPF